MECLQREVDESPLGVSKETPEIRADHALPPVAVLLVELLEITGTQNQDFSKSATLKFCLMFAPQLSTIEMDPFSQKQRQS